MPKSNESAASIRSMSAEIADLDALLNTKESFAKRVGLWQFGAGAVFAAVVLLVINALA